MSEERTEPAVESSRALARLRTLERRKLVSANLLAGKTEEDIAEELEVTTATVRRDIKAVRKLWQADAVDNIRLHKQLDLRRIESAIGALWNDVQSGHLSAIERLTKLLERKSRLLGMDAAMKIEKDTTVQFLVRAPEKLSMDEWDQRTQVVDAELVQELEGPGGEDGEDGDCGDDVQPAAGTQAHSGVPVEVEDADAGGG